MRILVTGAGGFIGRALVQRLLAGRLGGLTPDRIVARSTSRRTACSRTCGCTRSSARSPSLPAEVDDDTLAKPALSGGAHELAAEILIADADRRGWLRTCSLRPPVRRGMQEPSTS